jgi:cytosine/adenosine deaminase-related metal-dependent hydrolase
MSEQPFGLRARYVVPVSGPPIAGGVVVVRGSEIISVGRDPQVAAVEDLGDVVLLPGFVNAHTHLEFSDLGAPLGTPGSSLPDWIREVLGRRRDLQGDGTEAIASGLTESLGSGTTTLGEIATSDWRIADRLPAARPTTVMFRELIGPSLPRAQQAAATAAEFLQTSVNVPGVLPALSPHAPYTVQPRLLESLVELSQKFRVPLAMHLAESREELELLNLGSGPFREMLEAVGAWDASEGARLSCVLDYLTELARAERAIVVHGNYLDDEETAFLAEHAQKMSVVYCPRTHQFFEQEPYPLSEMLAAGVTMALGTDSRASNPDLSLLEEVRYVAANHPQVAPEKILELATLGGAKALGLDRCTGTLTVGKRADLVALDASGSWRAQADMIEALLHESSRVVGTWIGGVRPA